jgi:hypothetical protein
LGAPARVLPGAVDAVEGFGTGGVGCPWVVHFDDIVVFWHVENILLGCVVRLWRKGKKGRFVLWAEKWSPKR